MVLQTIISIRSGCPGSIHKLEWNEERKWNWQLAKPQLLPRKCPIKLCVYVCVSNLLSTWIPVLLSAYSRSWRRQMCVSRTTDRVSFRLQQQHRCCHDPREVATNIFHLANWQNILNNKHYTKLVQGCMTAVQTKIFCIIEPQFCLYGTRDWKCITHIIPGTRLHMYVVQVVKKNCRWCSEEKTLL